VNIGAVRDALAVKLEALTGVRVFSYVPDSVPVPAAVVGNVTVNFDDAQNRGLDQGTCDVLLIVSRMAERSAQDALDKWLNTVGVGSVKTIVEADQSLGGTVSAVRIPRAEPITVEYGGVSYFGYRYEVTFYG
jgi:hypothetical protein